ncbi:hypothetical protein LguiA_027665 [Lonicera macranthoides]
MAIEAQLYSDNLLGGGLQDWTENAYGFNEFCFDFQHQFMQEQHLQNIQPTNENLCYDNIVLLSRNHNNNNNESMSFSQSIALQVEKQRQEIDRFISTENERLRIALLQQRKQQLSLLLKNHESKIQILLRQKDEEISRAVSKAMELENLLRRMEIESQTWQRLAKENEAMVISLNNTIEQLKQTTLLLTNEAEDADSCCDMIQKGEKETGENKGHEVEKEHEGYRATQVICKSCNCRSSCLIFLPCRHLCSCKDCEAFLDSCPVCRTEKKAVIEALI